MNILEKQEKVTFHIYDWKVTFSCIVYFPI